MSDLYLVLRRRLEDVADWVELGSDVMRAARHRLGYSYETVGRLLHVSSKTYERYEKRGRVPVALIEQAGRVLDLEIQAPLRDRLTAEPVYQGEAHVLVRILEMIEALQADVAGTRQELADLRSGLADETRERESQRG